MIKRKFIEIHRIVMISILCCWALNAKASLIGDEIGSTFEISGFPVNLWDASFQISPSTPIPATVGAGIEYVAAFGATETISADFNANTLVLDYQFSSFNLTGADHVFTFTDLDWLNEPGKIIGLTETQNDFSVVSTSFTDDSISVVITNDGSAPISKTVAFNIVTAHVPVPAAVWLFSSGLIGLIGMRKRAFNVN